MDAFNVLNDTDDGQKIETVVSEIIRENYERFKHGYRSSDNGSWTSLSNTEPSQIWERHRFIWGAMLHSIECIITKGCNHIARQIVWEWMHLKNPKFLDELEKTLKEKFVYEIEKLIETEGKYPPQEEE